MVESVKKASLFKKQNDVSELLVDGEKIVEEAEISVGIYWKPFVLFVFAIFLALLVFELGVLLAVTSIIWFIYSTIKKEILMLVLTNKRILVRYGILQIDVVDMRFSKIESIELERMIPGYILGYSNVVLMGTGQRYVVIPYVGNGPRIRQAYNKMTLTEDDPQEVVVVQDKSE